MFLNPAVGLFKPSVIRQMTLRADAIPGTFNLSQGFPDPDFEVPDFVIQAADEANRRGYHQYAPPSGVAELRHAVAARSRQQLGFFPDPDREVTITCGATEAMYATVQALTQPGDAVVIPSPSYENYGAVCALLQLTPRFVRLRPPDWRPDLDQLRDAFRPQPPRRRSPRAILLCNPNNPTGTVYTREELDVIADLCRQYDVIAITDEVYENIVFDGRPHLSIAALEGMRERTVTISSASKTFSVTGWRVGTVIAEPELSRAICQVHDYITICAPRPNQWAVARSLETAEGNGYYAEFGRAYHRRRELLYAALTTAGFRVSRPEGAYYLLADISDSGEGDVALAERMLAEARVATVPASCFFFTDQDVGRRYVRFCFCKSDPILRGAADRLAEWQQRS